MTTPARLFSVALVIAALTPTLAWAHGLGVDCKLRGGKIEVEAFFDDDTPAHKAKVELRDGKDKVVASAVTDAKGRCAFAAPAAGKYVVHVDAGAGHRAKKAIAISATDVQSIDEGGATSDREADPRNLGEGPTREEFTSLPVKNLAIGIAVIGGGSVVVLLGMGLFRKNPT